MVSIKKLMVFCLSFLSMTMQARADHITGGQMYYTYAGNNNGQYQYSVTLKLYMRCNSGRQFNNPTIVSIFDRVTGARITDLTVNLSHQDNISLPSNSNPCVSNPPLVCYDVGFYNFTVSLAPSANGYVIASQVNYRIAGINNLTPGYGFIGATYTAEIPGTAAGPNAIQNSSAHFTGDDLVMVCADNPMSYNFGAEDNDGDRLQYSFCGAYVSGSSGTVAPPQSPPYQYVPYGQGFSESNPLGDNVHIDGNTGMITGMAPTAGVYVVTVCVQEIRNGNVIATQRKDLQIFIAPCTIAAALLDPEYMLCRDTKTIALANNSTSPLIHSYSWQVVNSGGTVLHSATTPSVTYTFSDTGIYRVKLAINPGDQCSDSTSALVRVYPGLHPDFDANGICFNKPTHFLDASTSVYGTINTWNWNFGEAAVANDLAFVRNPDYTYPTRGAKPVQLIVTNTKGCRDTVTREVSIVEKPPLDLAFRDTLICLHDAVQLQAIGNGLFSWTPTVQISNGQTAAPTVSPSATTSYVVILNDNGCLNKDSVRVRVVDHVDLRAMNDTVICQGDSARLHVSSNGLQYSWTPAARFIDPGIANPVCITPSTTTYQVKAVIGGCAATGNVLVTTVPYPLARAGEDTILCFGTRGQLHAQTNAPAFEWSPAASLSSTTALNPVASPVSTTSYIFSAFDNQGCPKPGKDTVVVAVRPRILAFAGRDTAVVVNQPLQLQASGGVSYQWTPAINLSASGIANPVALFSLESDGITYKVMVFDEAHCKDSAYIRVKIFRTPPSVFVPTAFTPNRDGLNDMVRPIAVGIGRILYFNIYNRWGQLIFSTTVNGRGWDGKVDGKDQAADTYIWVVKALDYKGNPYIQKGITTLIR